MTEDGPLYAKYHVHRNDGRDQPGGDREDAEYFVLDYVHDFHAREALSEYANSCELTHPVLADDLRHRLDAVQRNKEV